MSLSNSTVPGNQGSTCQADIAKVTPGMLNWTATTITRRRVKTGRHKTVPTVTMTVAEQAVGLKPGRICPAIQRGTRAAGWRWRKVDELNIDPAVAGV
ncbi:hypothetical protein ACERK3_19200 [Phycisphaerales bacterium AB-hyl4]|uniref:Uncharacterized protein n=1 Tax=Natronomicrosphaera hydrolytica TaxID=3242702 RepID=A0ABV4UBN2_9BACT